MGVFIPSFGCAGFCTPSGEQGGRPGKLPGSSLAGAPDRDCNPPPRSRQAFKLPALALGAALPTASPMGYGQPGDRGPACSAAFRHLRSVFGASQDPGSMPPNVFDLFLAGTRCKSLWRSTSADPPNFCLLSFMIHPFRSAQGPCKQRARKQVRSMRPIEPMHLDLPSLDF